MIRNCLGRLSLAVITLGPAAAGAQAAPNAPAIQVLTVYRETVKPGKGGAHDAHEVAWVGALAAAKSPTTMLAISAMSGPAENWYMSLYSTWAAYEKASKAADASPAIAAIGKQYSAMEGDFLSDARMMVLTSREDLSYGGPADLASTRYFSVTRITVRPGHAAEYEENRKLVKAAHESARLADRYSIWQAASGAPTGTYFLFVARKSLAELDDATLHAGADYLAALGGADGQKKMAANTANAVASQQADLFAVAPHQSVPSPEWVTADPGYWKHKPAAKKP